LEKTIDERDDLGFGREVVEDDVIIYSGATILGRVHIGQASVIGGNVWLTHSVPAGSQVTQARAGDDRPERVGGR
jgi:serine O-acetyltransferase